MKVFSLARFVAMTIVALSATYAGAQQVTEVRATASEQIALASQLRRGTYVYSSVSDRDLAIVRTAAALEVVRQKWPNDARAVVQSCLMEADVFLSVRAVKNALPVLELLAKYVKNSDNEPAVFRRLAEVYEIMQRRDDAIKYLNAAEVHGANRRYPHEEHATLLAAAEFHTRGGSPKEAAKRLRKASRITAMSAEIRANDALLAAGAHLSAGDPVEASADLDSAAELLDTLRPQKGPSNRLEAELDRLRKIIGKKR
jgi:tetratricopeptide (TPR) repeat protein